jgi:hypothetical protein
LKESMLGMASVGRPPSRTDVPEPVSVITTTPRSGVARLYWIPSTGRPL